MTKDPKKLYNFSELYSTTRDWYINESICEETIKRLISGGSIQEVSEKTYQITPKGIDIIADRLKIDIWKYIKEKYYDDFYTIESIHESFSETKFPINVFHLAIEKLCQEDLLKRVLTRDETTNIERVVYAITKKTTSARERSTGFKGDALKLTKAELRVIDAIAAKGGSNFTFEERASLASLTPQNFKQLMEQLIIKGFVKRKMTRTDTSKRVPTIFLTKKGIEVYNVRYKREKKRLLPPTMPLTDREQ